MKSAIKTLVTTAILVFLVACGKSKEEHAQDLSIKVTDVCEKITKALPEDLKTETQEMLQGIGVEEGPAQEYIKNFSTLVQTGVTNLEHLAIKHCEASDLQALNNVMDELNAMATDFITIMPKIWSQIKTAGLKVELTTLLSKLVQVTQRGEDGNFIDRLNTFLKTPSSHNTLETILNENEKTKLKELTKNFSEEHKAKIDKLAQNIKVLLFPLLNHKKEQVEKIKSELEKVSPRCVFNIINEISPFFSPISSSQGVVAK